MPRSARCRPGVGMRVRARRAAVVIATGGITATALAACTPGPVTDLALTITSYLPLTVVDDASPGKGFAAQAGVAVAVAEINAAELGVQITPSYLDTGTATAGELYADTTSAIIGPLDYNAARDLVSAAEAEGRLVISPGDATDESDAWTKVARYFRTAPPASAQGPAISRVMRADGRASAIVVTRDNLGGPKLGEAIHAAFDQAGGQTVNIVTYRADAPINAPVDAALQEKTDAVVYIGDAEVVDHARISVMAGYPADRIYLPERSFNSVPGDAAYAGMKAVAPATKVRTAFVRRLRAAHAELAPGTKMRGTVATGAQAYDAVIITALAAMQARSAEPGAIAAKIRDVTGGSAPAGAQQCSSFADCAELINAGTPIDYDGISGPLDMSEAGAPATAPMSVWAYTAEGTKQRIAGSVGAYVKKVGGGAETGG